MKRKKNMLALLLALAVLIGITFAATKLNPDYSETEPDTTTTIFTLDTAAVTSLQWKYSEDLAFERTEDGWRYSADTVFPLDDSFIDTALEALAEITSSRTIEGVTDWDQYGLEVPVCSITVTADETYTLSIGEETGLGGERYFSTGDGNVYLVDETIIDSFSYGLYDLLEYETIPDMSAVTGVELVSDNQSYTVAYQENSGKAYSDEYVWFMGEKVLDNELTEALISNITSLAWGECVEYNASDLSQYGLDTPAVTVTVHYTETATETQEQDASFTLEMGGEKDGDRYARIAGSNMVYLIDGDLCETLLYTTYQELMPDEVVLLDWDAVEALEITLNDETYEIVKSVKTVTDDDGNESEETVYLLGDAEVEATDIFDTLDGLTSTGYATGVTPERSQELRLMIRRESETFPEVELVFYQYDSAQCLTTLNGEATVFASREEVVDLVEDITQLVLGESE